ncbi:acyl-CoA dehydrogenase [Haloferax sp. MBLA0076]|uniref:Acyl-CoA dehydrogenase n=1 Tax=Haloferax litoreum TaxID=2666140 RepID=A0A6A8GJH2_9EURY|nr:MULTISPECIES: acyl-CoA dehydrogenase family protein [Haloferax]KAB1190433.1 acyl-CoA dehydrogenase [Haloferax sp. CBA1148]MRX23408.1 acyl-CoA dehydrogenase [Haloferax litoreum]
MEFSLSEEQRLIRKEIRRLCADFGDEYWREKDAAKEYPEEFHQTFADQDWYGLTIPEEYGGHGYGIQEGIIVQQEIARSGAAHAGVGLTGTQIFNSAPLIEYGTTAQKEAYLPGISTGESRLSVAVTEPNAGLDTSRLETFARRDGDEYVVNGQKVWIGGAQRADLMLLLARTEPRDPEHRFRGLTLFLAEFDKDLDTVDVVEMDKAGRVALDSNEVWFEDFRIPVENRIGEEGKGFKYLLTFANSERILVAATAIGIGLAALDKASSYASERVVFDNPIGSYQGIQHPLADSWSKLSLAEAMTQKAAWLYDNGEECGPESNAVKMRASEASVEACERAVRTLGGMGYSEEYDVARYWRESIITVIAPVSNELIKNYIAQKVLGLPRSY